MTDIRELTGTLSALTTAFVNSYVLFAANDANVFAYLEESASAEDVAEKLGWTTRTTRMLLDGLVALKLVTKSNGRYRNAEIASTCLVPGRPHYQGHIVKHNANSAALWPHLREALQTGRPVRSAGERERTPEELRAFILGMSDIGKMSAREMLEKINISPYTHMLDVGGGPGTYSVTFLQANPRMRATIFDRPDVVAIAREQVETAGLTNRISFREGDLTTDVLGEGYDLILVSNIIHSFGPEANRTLVVKCFDALEPGGTLIIKDFLTDNDRSGPAFSLLFALRMLVATGEGDTYSFEEVESWTNAAGFGPGTVVDLSPQTRLWIATRS